MGEVVEAFWVFVFLGCVYWIFYLIVPRWPPE